MSRSKNKVRKERRHVHLSEGSWDRLTELYKPQGITPSSVIDKLVSFHLRRIDEKANVVVSSETVPDVQVEADDDE